MKDDEPDFLESDSRFTILIHGIKISKAILMRNGEKIKDFKIEKDELGEDIIRFDMRTLPSGTIIHDNSKHLNLGLTGFKSLFSD